MDFCICGRFWNECRTGGEDSWIHVREGLSGSPPQSDGYSTRKQQQVRSVFTVGQAGAKAAVHVSPQLISQWVRAVLILTYGRGNCGNEEFNWLSWNWFCFPKLG